MTDRTMTRYIPIGDVELRLDMIARALGIPAATLDKLASGEWVAVPREPTKHIIDRMHEARRSGLLVEGVYRAVLAAATEAASHE